MRDSGAGWVANKRDVAVAALAAILGRQVDLADQLLPGLGHRRGS